MSTRKFEWTSSLHDSLCLGTGTASIRVKDINDMPPQFTKDEWTTEVDETQGPNLPEMPILTVTVHDEDETNKFQYKVIFMASNFTFMIS